jgi:hypothetical protein
VNDKYPAATIHNIEKYKNINYNFKNIPCFDDGTIFLINETNRPEAESDIMLLTDIFLVAHKSEPLFPFTRIYTDDIRFEASDALDPQQFCHFELYDNTSEDNTEYILILHFYITPDPRNIIYGDIYYLANGSIGKYNTVFEHENDIFFVNCIKSGNRLEVQRVLHNKGKRKKRFYPYIKIGMRAAYFISGTLVVITVALIFSAFYIYDGLRLKNQNVTVINPDITESTASSGIQDIQLETGNMIMHNIAGGTTDTQSISETSGKTETQSEITLISITSPIAQGETAALKIKGRPDTVYSITVFYSSGASTASGLEDKVSDSGGYAEWYWRIGNRTKIGTFKIEIMGGNETLANEITITE